MPVTEGHSPPTFRLLVVPGVSVDRWSRTWSQRSPGVELRLVPADVNQAAPLLCTGADAGLVRLPVDQDTFHAIPLYTEATVVVVPRDHPVAAADEVTIADLAGETLLRPLDDVLDWTGSPDTHEPTPGDPATTAGDRPATTAGDRPATTAAAVELVAAGAGVLVTPQSLARIHHRRDLTYRIVTDAPTSSVALVWPRDRYTELVEQMIGIVRGRTENSTRGRGTAPAPPPEPSARTRTRGGAGRATGASGRAGAPRGDANPRTPPRRRGR